MMRRTVAALAFAGLLSACAAGPRPEIPSEADIAAPANWRMPSVDGEGEAPREWWCLFDDPALTALVGEALTKNDDLAIAAARVEEARAQFDNARGLQQPAVSAQAAGRRDREVSAFGKPVEQWAGQAELRASYDLDLFGRLRNGTAAARAQLLATQYGRESLRLAIEGSVASGYVQLRTLDARLDILRRTLDARKATLALIRRRSDAGYGSQLELAQAQAEYQAAAQQIPSIELAITRQENGLSILLGRAPGPIGRGTVLTGLPLPAVPVALPADLLRRRPDLGAAEQQIVAADRSLDAARAAFMPDISLSASGGFVASSLLTGDPLSLFSLGGSILAPIFNGGRLQAQAKGAAARRDQAAFAYRKAVLGAFREVEDGMAAEGRLREQEGALAAERDALARARDLAASRYREGYSPYLEQLDAERGLLSSELALLQVRSDRLQTLVGLFQALGGGWRRSPSRRESDL
ncbi:efflux transporter outer membrane subunit [Sphingopyxis sp. LARHCG72]